MEKLIKELTFKTYNDRQQFEITEDGLVARAAKLRSTDKFLRVNGTWQKIPYEGYAIVSMLDNHFGNIAISSQLVEMQQYLLNHVTDSVHHFFPLPAASFHQTVANTLSSKRFKIHIKDQGLASKYPQIITEAFAKIPTPIETKPIAMKLIGISIFGSALGILGIFEQEEDFNRILNFRDHIYHNPLLNQVDIKRTRPFIGHLTMVYIDGILSERQKDQLVQACIELNKDIEKQELVFSIHKTELRYYKELSYFQSQKNFPSFNFISPSTLEFM